MSAHYTGIGWTRSKKIYDAVMALGLLAFLASFAAVALLFKPTLTLETVLIRGTALASFLLLHVILCIGPLARLDRRFLPLLFNRRHLGVAMFGLALVHAAVATFQFHALSRVNPLSSVFTAYSGDYGSFLARGANLAHFPFEPMGAAALLILFLMAATSHDFWLRNLGASFWKTMHLLVLAAYGLLVGHVAWGFLQSERSPGYLVLMGVGIAAVFGLHVAAAIREARRDRRDPLRKLSAAGEPAPGSAVRDGFVRVAAVGDLPEGEGRIARVAGKRVALYRQGDRIFALSNVCRHQGGPLGEGRIVDGCITCPWHGWQYRAEDGQSPPPFQEKIETYRVRVEDGCVYVHPSAAPPGTRQDGAPAGPAASEDRLRPEAGSFPAGRTLQAAARDRSGSGSGAGEFYIGYLAKTPAGVASFLRRWSRASVTLAGMIGLILAALQVPWDGGVFEFGVSRSFEGVLQRDPVPRLIRSAGAGTDVPLPRSLLLVGPGKSGPPEWAVAHAGRRVRFNGSLIQREGIAMVEMNDPDSFQLLPDQAPGGADPPAGTASDLRPGEEALLTGELVDTKCYLGVMVPSTGKVHRACAVRCLAGGVPPGLLLRGAEGKGRLVLLAGADGRELRFDPQWGGRVVRALGTLERRGDLTVLRARSVELESPQP